MTASGHKIHTSTYQVMEIPDASFTPFQIIAGGDVLSAVSQGFQHLMNSVASLSFLSTSVSIIFCYAPDNGSADIQNRLQLYFEIRSADLEILNNLSLIVERGPLGCFYPLRKTVTFQIPSKRFNAATRIIRRQEKIRPIHSSEFNDRIPQHYITIKSFSPNEQNDYLDIDRVLAGLDVPVLIIKRVMPVDIQAECTTHTRYLAHLESINRYWDRDEDESDIWVNFNSTVSSQATVAQNIRPLRRRDPLADDILRTQRRFHESLFQPHLEFGILTLTPSPTISRLIASLVAESAFRDGSYRLEACDVDPEMSQIEFLPPYRTPPPPGSEQETDLYAPLAKLVHVAPVKELSGLFRFPVASITSLCCIRKNTDPPHTKEKASILIGHESASFSVADNDLPRGPLLDSCNKSLFNSGAPGFGKTTSTINILLQLHANDIPFIVLEPVKTDYRIIKSFGTSDNTNARSLARTLEIYTPGDETVSPFRHNPLQLLPRISMDEHIGNLLNCFFAAMPATWPLPALIGEGLELVYENVDLNKPPVIADLITATGHVIDSKGYSTETLSDIRAAMEVRLGVLARRTMGKVFQCNQNVPSIAHLVQVPALIEMDHLSPDHACLLTLFLLTQVREYLRVTPQSDQKLRYVIVLEEAHRIAGAQHKTQPSPDVADAKGHATEIICQALVELRGLGVGVIIIDQFPSAVAPEVIKSTTTKLAFHQVAQQDREEVGSAMLFGQAEMEEIARLGVGEAFFITEGYYKPCKIQTTNLHSQLNFDTPILNDNILPYIKNELWYQQAFINRRFYELSRLKEDMDIFDLERMEINRQFIHLLSQDPTLHANEKKAHLNQLITETEALKKYLKSSLKDFLNTSFKKYYQPVEGQSINDAAVLALQNNLAERYKMVIQPDIQKALLAMDAFIERCKATK